MLEKWYVWDDYISAGITKYFLSNGWTLGAYDKLLTKVLRTDFDVTIIAYTLGEKVESKRVKK